LVDVKKPGLLAGLFVGAVSSYLLLVYVEEAQVIRS